MSAQAQIVELTAALEYSGSDQPEVHENILAMFCNDTTLSDSVRLALANDRLELARKLYTSISIDASTSAIFYRLEDKILIEKIYEDSHTILRDKFKIYLKNNSQASSKETLNLFLLSLLRELNDIPDIQRSIQSNRELMIANYLIGFIKENEPKISNTYELNVWFYNLNGSVKNLASTEFYRVRDGEEARAVGRIYNPIDNNGSNIHNWGINAAWAIGVARKQLPINIQAELTIQSGERTNRDRKGNPSAFALEIAIAIKMGYGLNIENNTIKLNPPHTLNDHRTNGIPGNGVLPTKEEQASIYRQCVQARELHTILSFNGGENLRKYVLEVCSNVDASAKLDFIGALELLHRGNSLKPILNALQEREHKNLSELLQSSSNNLAEIVNSYLNENQSDESENKTSGENSGPRFHEAPPEGLNDVELQQQSALTAIFRSYQELQEINTSDESSSETTQLYNSSIASSALTPQSDEEANVTNQENKNKTKSDKRNFFDKKPGH